MDTYEQWLRDEIAKSAGDRSYYIPGLVRALQEYIQHTEQVKVTLKNPKGPPAIFWVSQTQAEVLRKMLQTRIDELPT